MNHFGNVNKLNCASNENNYGKHIWDRPDANGHLGATACIVVPWLLDYVDAGGSWTAMAWWIHDHLPYSSLYFFTNLHAFNINWSEAPVRRVDSYAPPKGCLIAPGTPSSPGLNAKHYPGFPAFKRPPSSLVKPPRPVTHRAAALASVPAGATDQKPVTASPLPAATSPTDLGIQQRITVPAQSAAAKPTAPTAFNQTGPLSASTQGTGKVLYRAVHAKTKWRKAAGHSSLESAITGPNGAAALFRRKVRIDYATHGDPLFAVVWQEGASNGSVIRADASQPHGIRIVHVPVGKLREFDARGGASEQELARFFV